METNTLRSLATALILLAPGAAFAAEEPEAVYAKFHRAAVSGNLDELIRHGPQTRHAEMTSMSAAQKDATLKMAALLLPRAFTLRSKTVSPDGRSARLIVSGPGENLLDGKRETLYGQIRMVMEGSEWKVDESNWSNEQPALPAAAKPAAAPAAGKAPARAPGITPGGSMVGTSVPRTLGTAKPPCVYKAVMTAEDMENCK